MKLYIPEIGTVLQLEKDWTFMLHTERRNEALTLAADFPRDTAYKYSFRSKSGAEANILGWVKYDGWDWKKLHTLPAGSVLTLDRIYIRKGVSEFSSLSFNLSRKSVNPDFSKFAKNINTMTGRCRFWAKLDDANKIEFSDLQPA